MTEKRSTGLFSRKISVIQASASDKIFIFILYCLLTFALVVVLLPVLNVVACSLSDPSSIRAGSVWIFPVKPTLRAYEAVMTNQKIITGFLNSLFYMFFGTLVNLAMTMACAYPLSRKEFYGRGILTTIFVFTMYFGGGLVPTYMLVNYLGLIDSRLAMIIPGAMSVWFVIIARTYLQANIPDEMFEAAKIDGSGEFYFFLRIVLPLSAPIIAVLALYYGIGHWNAYFTALLYIKTQNKLPLQMILRSILIMNRVDPEMMQNFAEVHARQVLSDMLKYAVIVVSSIPVMILYPFVQKYFVKGVMIGALKG